MSSHNWNYYLLGGNKQQLANGNMNPGIGTKTFNGIFEARSKNGARVLFRNQDNTIQILGYSNKDINHQQKVINRATELYGK
ncbi:MAG: hypothetical protein JST20_12855 [Bacteroidetes bacterium]|nr:hypothetical protein [Bacteroidota bacterium]